VAATVVVRFRQGIGLPYEDAVGSSLGPEWGALQASFPGIEMRRRIRSVLPARLASFVALSSLPGRRGASRLLRTFEVRCPPNIDPWPLAAALAGWPDVESAYVQPRLRPATVNYMDDPQWVNQGYLQPAPYGVNAIGAWQLAGGDGAGRTIVDIEADWKLGHRDLPGSIPAGLLYGMPSGATFDLDHGLMTLGVLCAVDNTVDCIGMAPAVTSVLRASYVGPDTFPKDLENAIIAATEALSGVVGAVILLEVELESTAFVPHGCVDLLPAVRDAIRTAVDAGIVVVEAAGNGRNDLDVTPDADGIQSLDTNWTGFPLEDSGAILVGAGTSEYPHARIDTSWSCNYGRRVDVYAWGQNVRTLSETDLTALYEGSSSAAAIIAGAAVQIQGIAIQSLGAPIDPWALRLYLREPANGTPSANPAGDMIGVMPDIVKVVTAHATTAIPDVYARDFVGDDGSTGPSAAPLWMSPDIIVRQSPTANHQAAYGEGSGHEDDTNLCEQVQTGHDHHVYVRVRNRGGIDATQVLARVWYAEASTLLLPQYWKKIGDTVIATVPTGGALTVSPGLLWPAAAIPSAGHYCFISEIVDPISPKSAATAMADYNAFLYFVRNENNVVWRNFNVVTYIGPSPQPLPLSAWAGSPRGPRPLWMSVEVDAALPRGASVHVRTPDDWLSRIAGDPMRTERTGDGAMDVRSSGRTIIASGWFPPGVRARIELVVTMPRSDEPRPGSIALRQFDREGEVGRVTWRIVPQEEARSASR